MIKDPSDLRRRELGQSIQNSGVLTRLCQLMSPIAPPKSVTDEPTLNLVKLCEFDEVYMPTGPIRKLRTTETLQVANFDPTLSGGIGGKTTILIALVDGVWVFAGPLIGSTDGLTDDCGCCNCTHCVPPELSDGAACLGCPNGCTKIITIDFGEWARYPGAAGNVALFQDPDVSCDWFSAPRRFVDSDSCCAPGHTDPLEATVGDD